MVERMRIVAALLVLVLSSAAFAEAPTETDEALKRADALWKAGQADEAFDLVEAALEGVKDDDALVARLETVLGGYRLAQGEPYAALPHLEVAAEKRGEVTDHLRLAEALLAVARQALVGGRASSLQVTPYLADARQTAEGVDAEGAEGARRDLILAEILYWEGDLESAGQALDKIDRDLLTPKVKRALYELTAQVRYREGRFADAAKAFRAAENPRGEASAWSAAKRPKELVEALGLVLEGRAYSAALVDWAVQCAVFANGARALLPILTRLAPAEPEAAHRALALGRLHESLGDVERATNRYREAADLAPGDAAPWLELGRLAYADGQPDPVGRATTCWIQALQRQPEHERALGFLWDQAGRDYGAAWRSPAALQRSLRIQEALAGALGDDGLAWANYGNTLRIAGRLEEALRAYDKALGAEPDDPGIVSDRGLVLSALGRKDAALAAFTSATRLDPDHDAAHQNAARARALQGDLDAAWRHLEQALGATRRAGRGSMRYRFLASRLWRGERGEMDR